MKKWLTIFIVIIMTSLCTEYFIPLETLANGVAVGPSALEIDNALRNEEYEKQIVLFNPGEEEIAYTLDTEGDAKAWISFWNNNAAVIPSKKISIPAHDEKNILVKIVVPKDAINGQHEASIVVTNVLTSENGQMTGQGVQVSAQVSVSIMVTGDQILAGTINSISTADTEADNLLQLKISFQNTGNVIATPLITVSISANGSYIDKINSAETQIGPGNTDIILVGWDTTGRQTGSYSAHITISLGNTIIAEDTLEFSILPTGTLTRSGTLTQLEIEGKLEQNKLIVILANFVNTCQVNTKAIFLGEIYFNNGLIDVIESDEISIAAGASNKLKSYLQLENSGQYLVKGYVNYEGNTTEIQELSFSVGETNKSESSYNWLIIGIITGIASLIVGIVVIIRIRT
ncbi:MAG: hypothetical protein PHQ86_04975 [Dehalococcoidales bacterium]|nr:hypothetical protein [Dehalococcoidales bacterium]